MCLNRKLYAQSVSTYFVLTQSIYGLLNCFCMNTLQNRYFSQNCNVFSEKYTSSQFYLDEVHCMFNGSFGQGNLKTELINIHNRLWSITFNFRFILIFYVSSNLRIYNCSHACSMSSCAMTSKSNTVWWIAIHDFERKLLRLFFLATLVNVCRDFGYAIYKIWYAYNNLRISSRK